MVHATGPQIRCNFWSAIRFSDSVRPGRFRPRGALNFRQLKYFVATAELGQVSRAARELSISQSAVTTVERDLEAEIGARLFERTARGMALTGPGRRFLETACRLLATVEEVRQTAVADAGVSGTLSVAATHTVLGYFLPRIWSGWRAAFPRCACNSSSTVAR